MKKIKPYLTYSIILTLLNTTSAFGAQTLSESAYHHCLLSLESQAVQAKINSKFYLSTIKKLNPDFSVLDKLNDQPEFHLPAWDYMASLVDQERVKDGIKAYKQYKSTLQKIYQKYPVNSAIVLAVWGVESNFGQTLGKTPILNSLSTLSCFGRRQSYFQGEFLSALKILQNGDITLQDFQGSWAGAFGSTQFMPSTFLRLAVDFDGDGQRDLIHNYADALASTANFLMKSGWKPHLPWGVEVRIPANIKDSNWKERLTIEDWSQKGITLIDGSHLTVLFPQTLKVGLLLPAGSQGPAFLVTQNFTAIYRYNASTNYALAIAHLADRIMGKGDFVQPWPTDDLGLSRKERIQLQQRLQQKGYDIGKADGLMGSKTRNAIKAEQKRLGLPQTGLAGQKLFHALMNKTLH